MVKRKFIYVREKKDYKQFKLTEKSSYCRREKGQINPIEWGKLAAELGVSIKNIYEADEINILSIKTMLRLTI